MSNQPGKENLPPGRTARVGAASTTATSTRSATTRPTVSGIPPLTKEPATSTLTKRPTVSAVRPTISSGKPSATSSSAPSSTAKATPTDNNDNAIIEQLKSKLEALSMKLTEKEQENAQLQLALEDSDISGQFTAISNANEVAKLQIEQLLQEKEALCEELESRDARICALQSGEKSLMKKNQEMEREFQNLQMALETAINARVSAENFSKTLQSSQSDSTQALTQLQQTKQAEIDQLEAKLSKAQTQINDLQDELATAIDLKKKTFEDYADLKSQFVDIEVLNASLNEDVSQLSAEKTELMTQLIEKEEELENGASNHGELEAALQDKTDELAKLTAQAELLQLRVDDLESTVADQSKLILSKEQLISTHEATIQTEKLKFDQLDFDYKQQAIRIDQLESQITSLRNELDSASTNNVSNQQQVQLLRDEFDVALLAHKKELELEAERYNALDLQYKSAQNNAAGLQERIQEFQDEEKQLQEQIKCAQDSCESVTFDLEERTAEVKSLENKVREMSTQLTAQMKKCQDLQGEILDLDDECQKLTDITVPELERELSTQTEKAQRFESKLADMEAKYAAAYEEKVQLNVLYNTTQAELNTKVVLMEETDKITQQLQLECSQLRAQLNELNTSYEEKLTILGRLQQDYYTVSGDKSTAEQTANTLTQQVFELETNAALLNTKLETLQLELQSTQRDAESASQQYKSEIEQLDNDIKSLRNKNTILDTECIQLSEQLQMAEHNYQLLQEEAQEKLDEYDIKFDDFTYKRKETEQLLKSRAKEAQSAQQEVAKLTEEKVELHVQVGKLRDEMMLLQQELSNKNNALAQLTRITADNRSLNDKVALLEQQKNQLRTTVTSYEADKVRNKDIESKYLELLKVKDDLSNEKLRLNQELQTVQNKLTSHQQIIEKQTHAIDSLNGTVQAQKKKNDDLSVQCAELSENIEEANGELRVANDFVTGLNKKYDTTVQKMQEYKEKVRSLSGTKLDQESTIERLQREVQDLQSELNMLQRVPTSRRAGATTTRLGSNTETAPTAAPSDETTTTARRTRRIGADSLNTDVAITTTAPSSSSVSIEERKHRIAEARAARRGEQSLE